MQREEFHSLLLSATEKAKIFALNYIENTLPDDNVYRIYLSVSEDDPGIEGFDVYPDDNGKVIKIADANTVVATIVRKEKIPVWIDISVFEVFKGKTVLSLFCAGRYCDNREEWYYRETDFSPFGIKSPVLPIDYTYGRKFTIPGKQSPFWHRLFKKGHR
jgi:hypothetical protein